MYKCYDYVVVHRNRLAYGIKDLSHILVHVVIDLCLLHTICHAVKKAISPPHGVNSCLINYNRVNNTFTFKSYMSNDYADLNKYLLTTCADIPF